MMRQVRVTFDNRIQYARQRVADAMCIPYDRLICVYVMRREAYAGKYERWQQRRERQSQQQRYADNDSARRGNECRSSSGVVMPREYVDVFVLHVCDATRAASTQYRAMRAVFMRGVTIRVVRIRYAIARRRAGIRLRLRGCEYAAPQRAFTQDA